MIDLGFDPGIAGGWALIKNYELIGAWLYPLTADGKEVDIGRLSRLILLLLSIFPDEPVRAMLEWSNARKQNGKNSIRTSGARCGDLRGMLQTLGIHYETIDPAQWKRIASVTYDKSTSVAKCIKMWPKHEHQFRRTSRRKAKSGLVIKWVLLDGPAEAALLAELLSRSRKQDMTWQPEQVASEVRNRWNRRK